MIEFITFVGLILPKAIPYLIGMLIWALLREIQKQQKKEPTRNKRRTSKPSTVGIHSGIKPETQQLLYSMCGGDRELVLRLVGGGGQAAWEKAIYDLERDRR